MKIKYQTDLEMLIVQANVGFKGAVVVILGIGALATIGIALSGEGMVNAIVPILMVAAGSLGLRFGGKPDSVRIDRTIGLLEVREYPGAFGRPNIQHFALSEIETVELDESLIHMRSSGMARKALALAVRLKDGRTETITPYYNRKRQVRGVYERVQQFLG